MVNWLLPALYALFIWWFSTGVIIYLDGLPPRTFGWSMAGATAILVVSIYGLGVSATDTSVGGAYAAFSFGLLAWGWQEISFYMGFVTGPRRQPCAEGCIGWRHFGHAVETSLYHELAIIICAGIVVALTWNAPNQVGLWTFMVLWWMHQSAKLNVFFGVRNLNEEFLPEHLQFLKSFLTKRSMNLLFPVSVTISTIIATLLFAKAAAGDADAFTQTGYTFLGTMMLLAILEHWFLVLPLPAAALWKWGLRSHQRYDECDIEIVAGFLGAGKTTFMQRRLAAADPDQRTVVLVNDFSAVGVDGSLLRGRGADVVELPNGCICCSLRQDLAEQIRSVIARWAPRRILIEPSGVANATALLQAVDRTGIRGLRIFVIIDAAAFLNDYARMPEYFRAQSGLPATFIVNKTDLIGPATLAMVENTLRALNPHATIVPSVFGVTEPNALDHVASEITGAPVDIADGEAASSGGHDHEDVELGFASWSSRLASPCDLDGLSAVLGEVASGAYGQIERVKGIVRAGPGWVHFDVAGGRSSMTAFAPVNGEEARVVAIGRIIDESGLSAAFDRCAVPVLG